MCQTEYHTILLLYKFISISRILHFSFQNVFFGKNSWEVFSLKYFKCIMHYCWLQGNVAQQISWTVRLFSFNYCVYELFASNFPLPLPPILLLDSINSAILDNSYEWTHAVFSFLWLAYFSWHTSLKVHPCFLHIEYFTSLLRLNSIPVYVYALYLFIC